MVRRIVLTVGEAFGVAWLTKIESNADLTQNVVE
jgi:hypothetical protein